MSILIKGMEMPKSCKECQLGDHHEWCLIEGDWRERKYMPDDRVSEYCPLIEIPPHGRLIDADNLVGIVTDATILGDGFKQVFVAIVNGEPTIIEAERSES